MLTRLERRQNIALQVFDLEDSFARNRRVRGPHPRPFGNIQFFIVAQFVGGVQEFFSNPFELKTVLNPSGYHLFFGKFFTTDKVERTTLFDNGRYTIRVQSEYYQPIEKDVDLPMPDPHTPLFIDLKPGYAYPFPTTQISPLTLLYGKVQNNKGNGLANITISAAGIPSSYLTDTNGQWVLIFPNNWQTDHVTIQFLLPDNTSQQFPNIEVIQGRTNSVTPFMLPG